MEKQSHEYAAVPIDPEAGVDAPPSPPSNGSAHVTCLLLL